ncbi:hypothetical protein FOZ62_006242 [Perkinsus olseni]|uniref:Uncharacterized protein n=1 Tax=Perkinsus olseni TaxID=32597 RepID=A0A7J6Q360_PEROL|nr:hypothetical protein FOZ62_006242 [Perkinsus olseni]
MMKQKSSLRRADTEGGRSTKSVGFSTRRTRHYRKGEESPSDSSNGGGGKRMTGRKEGSSPRSGESSSREPVEPSSLMVSVEEPLSPMDSNTFSSDHGAERLPEGRPAAGLGGDASPSSTVGTPNKTGLGGNHTTPLKWIRRTSLTGRSDSSRDDFLGTVPLEFPTRGQAESRPVKEVVTNRSQPEPSVEVPPTDVEEDIASPDPKRDSKPPSSALARRQKTPMPPLGSRDGGSPLIDSDDSRLLSELGDLTQGATTTQPMGMLESREKNHGDAAVFSYSRRTARYCAIRC